MSVLVIAGLDSSGGAGVLRDCAVLAEHGLTARVAVTAVTAQGAIGVTALHPVPPAVVAAQITACGPVRAIKSGMLANAGIVRTVARALPPGIPFVLDPVLAASSDSELMDAAGRAALRPSPPRACPCKRGTGCTLATALTALTAALARGADLAEACADAREHLQRWLGSVDGPRDPQSSMT